MRAQPALRPARACCCRPCIPTPAPAAASARSPACSKRRPSASCRPSWPRARSAHYRKGWEEKDKAGHSLIDRSKLVRSASTAEREGASLPGHYDGGLPAIRRCPRAACRAAPKAGADSQLAAGAGGQARAALRKKAHRCRCGGRTRAGGARTSGWSCAGWFSNVGILAPVPARPLAGMWIVKGNLNFELHAGRAAADRSLCRACSR
jgi:hypothetical protein